MKCATDCSNFFILPTYVFWPVSIAALFGNIFNMLIFSDPETRKSPVNSLFWWLSLSDLLELIILAHLRIFSESGPYLDIFMLSDLLSKKEGETLSNVAIFLVFLLMAIHFCSVSLKITLAGAQFTAAGRSLQNESSAGFWDLRSVKQRAIWIYILSFLAFSQFLFRIYFDEHGSQIPNLILLFVAALNLVAFIVLIVTSFMFIFAVARTRSICLRSLTSAESAIAENKSMKKINNSIIFILLGLIILDISRALHGFGTILFEIPNIMFAIHDAIYDLSGINLPKVMRFCLEKIPCLHWFFILVNCFYSTFGYAIFIPTYRKTFKLIVGDWYNMIRPAIR